MVASRLNGALNVSPGSGKTFQYFTFHPALMTSTSWMEAMASWMEAMAFRAADAMAGFSFLLIFSRAGRLSLVPIWPRMMQAWWMALGSLVSSNFRTAGSATGPMLARP